MGWSLQHATRFSNATFLSVCDAFHVAESRAALVGDAVLNAMLGDHGGRGVARGPVRLLPTPAARLPRARSQGLPFDRKVTERCNLLRIFDRG